MNFGATRRYHRYRNRNGLEASVDYEKELGIEREIMRETEIYITEKMRCSSPDCSHHWYFRIHYRSTLFLPGWERRKQKGRRCKFIVLPLEGKYPLILVDEWRWPAFPRTIHNPEHHIHKPRVQKMHPGPLYLTLTHANLIDSKLHSNCLSSYARREDAWIGNQGIYS